MSTTNHVGVHVGVVAHRPHHNDVVDEETTRKLHALLRAYNIDKRWFPIYEDAIRTNREARLLCTAVTEREMEVIVHIMRREGYRAAARELGITQSAIGFHLQNAISKVARVLKLKRLRPRDFLLKYDNLICLPLR